MCCRKRYKKRNEETEKINRGNGGSMIKGAIFDVDGTLLDSMGIWKDVGVRYLNSIGIEAEPDLGTGTMKQRDFEKILNNLFFPE